MMLSAREGRWCRSITSLLILACFSISPLKADQPLQPLPWLLLAAPFHLRDLEGHFHQLSDFRDRRVIVSFWASWCAPCRNELPSMNRAWAALNHEPVVMLAINVDEEREAIEAWIQLPR